MSLAAAAIALLGQALPAVSQSDDSYDWNGAYGGGNLGGAFGGSDILSALGSSLPCLECQVYPGVAISGNPAVMAAFGSSDLNPKSLTGGVQLGYNYRANSILWGIEIDANLLRANASKTRTAQGLIPGATPPHPAPREEPSTRSPMKSMPTTS